MIRLLAAGLVLHGVVDQMDAGIAAIEWASEEISYLPVTALPPDTVEGDAIVLRIRQLPLRRIRGKTTAAQKSERHQRLPGRGVRRER